MRILLFLTLFHANILSFAFQLQQLNFPLKSNEDAFGTIDNNELESSDTSIFDNKLDILDAKIHRRFSNQVVLVLERIENLESTVSNLRRILLVDWQRTSVGFIYKSFKLEKTWEDANEMCNFFGATLAQINNESRNNIIKSLVIQNSQKELSSDGFWIGVKTKAEMSNTTSNYSNFNEDLTLDGCALIDQTGKWKIRSCNQTHKFICQLNENW